MVPKRIFATESFKVVFMAVLEFLISSYSIKHRKLAGSHTTSIANSPSLSSFTPLTSCTNLEYHIPDNPAISLPKIPPPTVPSTSLATSSAESGSGPGT